MKTASGILAYRFMDGKKEFLLTHPGGPYYENVDVWTVPKGEMEEGEDSEFCARREFKEETGKDAPEFLVFLGSFKTSKTKISNIFVGYGDVDETTCTSDTCDIVYNGVEMTIPEVDGWKWFDMETALEKITPGQKQILEKIKMQEIS